MIMTGKLQSVLLVEDHPLNRKLLKRVVTRAGFSIRCAHDALMALQMLEESPADIILMDIQLPGLSGLELTEMLRADLRFADTPIIAVSAYAGDVDRQRALEAGCSGFIGKPINTRTFIEEVLALADRAVM